MNVQLVSANPLSSKAPVATFLRSSGVSVLGEAFESVSKYTNDIKKIAESHPQIIVDDGAELHSAYAETTSKSCYGGTDETTSGTVRLNSMQKAGLLHYPVIPVNEARSKHFFDNKYGTGQSTLDGLLRATGLLVAGKVVVVAGYGWVGKGVAKRARGMGARVIVTEVEPLAALEAHLDGFEVKKMQPVAEEGQIFLTCTGQINVLDEENFLSMRDGAILGNCGHFDREINVRALKRISKSHEQINQLVTEYRIRGRSIYLLCDGRVVNLVAAEGHPPEIMQLSFADQLLSIFYVVKNRASLYKGHKKVLPFPKEIDDLVARFSLTAFDLNIDKLTRQQMNYNSFL